MGNMVKTTTALSQALIEAYYHRFMAADYAGMIDLMTDDVEHFVNLGNLRVGKAAFQDFLNDMKDIYSDHIYDLVIFTAQDGLRAAAEFRVKGKYLTTEPGYPEAWGQEYDIPVGAFFSVRDGQISRVTVYYNLGDWVKQVTK